MVTQLQSKQNMQWFLTKDIKYMRHANKKDVVTDQRYSRTLANANTTQEHNQERVKH